MKIERKIKSPAKVLRVTIDGKCVQGKNSTETFLMCINMLGAERIAAMDDIRTEGLPLVVPSLDKRLQMKQLNNNWFVCTHMSTSLKKIRLEQIAQRLGVNMEVEIM